MNQKYNHKTYLKHQNQQAYLHYCQQIIYYLHVLNWLKTMYMCQKSTIYSQKRTLGSENLNQDTHLQNSQLKSLKYLGKWEFKENTAPESAYDTMGRLLKITNAQSKTFSYSYDNNGNKLNENDFNGNIATFEYDDANRLETKTEPLGKVTTYSYDNVGNVLTETTAGRKATYGYSPQRYFLTSFTGEGPSEGESRSEGNDKSEGGSRSGEPAVNATTVRTVDGEGNILTETDPNNNLTTFTYDGHNRLKTEAGPLGSGRTISYDNNGNVLQEITLNSTGNQARLFSYDGANRRIASTNAEAEITTYVYDGNGNILTETLAQGKQTAFVYDSLNLVTSKTQANGTPAVWTYFYDLAGNLITETQPNGNVLTTVYDELNRPTNKNDSIGLIAKSSYDANSNILSETDSNGNLTSHAYNGLNQRITTSMPLNRNHSFTYTPFGEMLTDTGPNGTISYTINTLGQRTNANGPNGYNEVYGYDVNDNLKSFTDSRGIITTYGINALNQTTSQTTGAFSKTLFYDSIGNKLTETDYKGTISAYTYDKENRQLTFSRAGQLQQTTVYNTAGLPQSVTDANGNTSAHQYNTQYYRTQTNLPETQVIKYTPNAFGDITLQDNPGQNDITSVYDLRRRLKSSTNGAGEQIQYEYDLNNNRTTVTKPDGTRYHYVYDAANRLTSISNTIESITTTYGYDNKDNLVSITDAENKATTFTFDNRNRKLSKHYPDDQAVNYSYDGNGNIKTVGLPNGVGISYDYDVLNRKTSENYSGTYGSASITFSLDANGNATTITESLGGNNFSTSQSFDNLDRMKSREDIYGNKFNFEYDNNGNRKTFKDHNNALTSYTFDGLNRLKKLTHSGLGTFNWSHNSAGLTNSIDYPNGASVEYDYDSANRITSIENKKSGADISKHVYTYDNNGNRLTMRETNIHTNQLIDYTYDKADRLRSVEYPNNEKTTYVLDKVGNRKSEIITGTNPNTKTYGYNTRDQLVTISDTLGSNTAYTFDTSGNQLTKDKDGMLTTFDYTARQRVKSITIGAGNPINYQYDFTGQRVNYQANGIEKRYAYDGLTLIAETNTIGNTLVRYHYGDRYQLAETRNTTNSYFHVDSMGTNVAVTNQDGSIQARYEYDAYGNLLTQAGSSEQPFGFTGYQKDEETGLYYAKARYYSPEEGRFLREAPLSGNPNNPPSLHRYNYAYSNPTRFIDPDGKYAEDGHYYTTWIVAQELGFSTDEVATLALYSQLPDEIDSLDAMELVKNQYLSAGLFYFLESKERVPLLHALQGGSSEIETDRTSRAIVDSKDDLRAAGFLIHRLADTFAHRKLKDRGTLYDSWIGHLLGGHTPDVIQRDPEQYEDYVRTLTSTLAQVKGGIDNDELKRITQNILAKTSKIKNLPISSSKFQGLRDGIITIEENDTSLAKRSIAVANEIVEQINKERVDIGLEPIAQGYRPEDGGPSFICCFDVWTLDALETYYRSTTDVGTLMEFLDIGGPEQRKFSKSLDNASKTLDATQGIPLKQAIKANKALIIIESNDNETELRK